MENKDSNAYDGERVFIAIDWFANLCDALAQDCFHHNANLSCPHLDLLNFEPYVP